MSSSDASHGIFDGFEGYRDPTEGEVLDMLQRCLVVLDTNVLLDIYEFEEPARILALDVLESLGARLWVPHQVVREFWRNRHGVIAAVPDPVQPIDAVRNELLTIVNSLRPDRERPEEIRAIRETVQTQLDALAEAIGNARGDALDISRILSDTSLDPVVGRLERILDGKVGAGLHGDEEAVVNEGLRRFAAKIPPGYKDGEDKEDQVPERGTGDFLIWEQVMRHLGEIALKPEAFVLVTNDAKEDWRVNLMKPKKRVLGVRPELVAEALARTGVKPIVLLQNNFYRLMSRIRPGNEAASESLVEASAVKHPVEAVHTSLWSLDSYERLLLGLTETGNQIQADIISLAARAGGFIARAEIYEHAGYPGDRSLRRFAMPAHRISLALAEDGHLAEDAAIPLEAIYEGPGKAIGYRVPPEFEEFESQRARQVPWVQAAAAVAASDPDRTWTVSELVAGIGIRGLRDLSTAQTPEATLRRDLTLRDSSYFERAAGGFRLRGNSPALNASRESD